MRSGWRTHGLLYSSTRPHRRLRAEDTLAHNALAVSSSSVYEGHGPTAPVGERGAFSAGFVTSARADAAWRIVQNPPRGSRFRGRLSSLRPMRTVGSFLSGERCD